jgi:hypothetical protein
LRDAEWIANLFQASLLKGSFVLEQNIRDLRQFPPYRKALIRDIISQKSRIEKLLRSNGYNLLSFFIRHLWRIWPDYPGTLGANRADCQRRSGCVSEEQSALESFKNLIRVQWDPFCLTTEPAQIGTGSS